MTYDEATAYTDHLSADHNALLAGKRPERWAGERDYLHLCHIVQNYGTACRDADWPTREALYQQVATLAYRLAKDANGGTT